MTPASEVDIERALRRAFKRREEARQVFDEVIRNAHSAGLSMRRIAGIVGLSHQAIHKIIHRSGA